MKIKVIISSFAVILTVTFFSFSTGVGVYTFHYAKGSSYLVDDSKSCLNCHVMKQHYDSWNKSSHRSVTTCNSCHAPHDSFGKLTTKAINGFNHSWAFTFSNYKEPIQIKEWNKRITLRTCVSCHDSVVHQSVTEDNSLSCISCHQGVGHF